MNKKKIAILGASYLQRPLVIKAKQMGLETHVFAWRDGNEVEGICDHYYDISILDKDAILAQCKRVQIDGITSIASDIAMPSVNYVAHEMGLSGNSLECTILSTDKFEMRKAFSANGVNCPKFTFFKNPYFSYDLGFTFPVIVKPTDRSGSRGVTKVYEPSNVNNAIEKALENSINGKAIVEEFIEGREFSVEGISFKGKHRILTITDKVTTGEPFFTELEHHQPANINLEQWQTIEKVVIKVLSALNIENGASHTEVILTKDNVVRVIESAGRMGGDWIGSHMVEASTGVDFLKATIKIALGEFDFSQCNGKAKHAYSGVYFITPKPGKIENVEMNIPENSVIKDAHVMLRSGDIIDEQLDGSGKRAAILFYVGDEYSPLDRNSQKFLSFKVENNL